MRVRGKKIESFLISQQHNLKEGRKEKEEKRE